jgi:hypothetical protein
MQFELLGNLYATTDSLSPAPAYMSMPSNFRPRHAGINVTVQNFWLQVGSRNLYVDGAYREFNSMPHIASITLNQDGIASSSGDIHWYSSGWLHNVSSGNASSFGIDVMEGGSVDSLTMTGGTVNNAGTIHNLTVGGGTYSGTGTVGDLRFQSNGGVFTIAGWSNDDGFGFMNVDTADLTNANLALNLSGMLDDFDVSRGVDAWASAFFGTFGDDALSWETLFGTESVGGTVNFLGINWGDEENIIPWTAESGWSGTNALAFSDTGVTLAPTAIPEPGTLAMLGLGLAGLGLWRRVSGATRLG